MDVRVADHQVETGDSLKEHAIQRIEEITEKYYSRAVGANVTFGKGPYADYTCDIVAPIGQGVVLKASNRGQTAQLAFEGAATKVEKQLRRYMRREVLGRAQRPEGTRKPAPLVWGLDEVDRLFS